MFSEQDRKPRIAVIGGGPGGLFVSWLLQQQSTFPYELTIFEASARLGGKVRTARFSDQPVRYEAGAAELYDYSHIGPDPLRELIRSFGLPIQAMGGRAVVYGENLYATTADFAEAHGENTRRALETFDARARAWSSPEDYYDSDWSEEKELDPMERRSFADELDRVKDETARRFLEILVHSDVATEPHRTSAAYGLQNYLMNEPEYMQLYTIEGGIERLTEEVARKLTAHVRFETRVERVERLAEGKLRVTARSHGECTDEDFDWVIGALPVSHLSAIAWTGGSLPAAMRHHRAQFDFPAHYLRVSVLFREVFWHDILRDSFMMLDAFGGCCLYDESSRNGCVGFGTLGWLLAGDAATMISNLPDADIVERVLAALPEALRERSATVIEAKVHRWIGEVNGRPGGSQPLAVEARHVPDGNTPNLLLVGDYLFDSTLNGVLDSAEFVAEHICDLVTPDEQAIATAGRAA